MLSGVQVALQGAPERSLVQLSASSPCRGAPDRRAAQWGSGALRVPWTWLQVQRGNDKWELGQAGCSDDPSMS